MPWPRFYSSHYFRHRENTDHDETGPRPQEAPGLAGETGLQITAHFRELKSGHYGLFQWAKCLIFSGTSREGYEYFIIFYMNIYTYTHIHTYITRMCMYVWMYMYMHVPIL